MNRVAVFATSVAIFSGAFFLGPVSCEESFDQAFRILSTALSILAGMVLALMALLGDPSSLFPGKWQEIRIERHLRRIKLDRFRLLFWIYLLVIAIALFATVLDAHHVSTVYEEIVLFLKRLSLGLGCVSVFWSFWLPSVIRAAQLERLKAEEERIKKRDMIPAEDL